MLTIASLVKRLFVLCRSRNSRVKIAVDRRTNVCVAIKVMDKQKIRAQKFTAQVRREIYIMRCLKHRHIVRMHEVLTSETKLYIVMELVTGGELFSRIAKGRVSEDVGRHYFQQLVDGVDFCHKKGVAHRDLKPENLLVDKNRVIKITDFGFSSMKGKDVHTGLLYTQCGTPDYCAPEIISSAQEGYSGAKVDAWACGVILYTLLCGQLPFQEPDTEKLYDLILTSTITYPPFISSGARDVLENLLTRDPSKRFDLQKVKRHPWFLVNYDGDDAQLVKKRPFFNGNQTDRKVSVSNPLPTPLLTAPSSPDISSSHSSKSPLASRLNPLQTAPTVVYNNTCNFGSKVAPNSPSTQGPLSSLSKTRLSFTSSPNDSNPKSSESGVASNFRSFSPQVALPPLPSNVPGSHGMSDDENPTSCVRVPSHSQQPSQEFSPRAMSQTLSSDNPPSKCDLHPQFVEHCPESTSTPEMIHCQDAPHGFHKSAFVDANDNAMPVYPSKPEECNSINLDGRPATSSCHCRRSKVATKISDATGMHLFSPGTTSATRTFAAFSEEMFPLNAQSRIISGENTVDPLPSHLPLRNFSGKSESVAQALIQSGDVTFEDHESTLTHPLEMKSGFIQFARLRRTGSQCEQLPTVWQQQSERCLPKIPVHHCNASRSCNGVVVKLTSAAAPGEQTPPKAICKMPSPKTVKDALDDYSSPPGASGSPGVLISPSPVNSLCIGKSHSFPSSNNMAPSRFLVEDFNKSYFGEKRTFTSESTIRPSPREGKDSATRCTPLCEISRRSPSRTERSAQHLWSIVYKLCGPLGLKSAEVVEDIKGDLELFIRRLCDLNNEDVLSIFYEFLAIFKNLLANELSARNFEEPQNTDLSFQPTDRAAENPLSGVSHDDICHPESFTILSEERPSSPDIIVAEPEESYLNDFARRQNISDLLTEWMKTVDSKLEEADKNSTTPVMDVLELQHLMREHQGGRQESNLADHVLELLKSCEGIPGLGGSTEGDAQRSPPPSLSIIQPSRSLDSYARIYGSSSFSSRNLDSYPLHHRSISNTSSPLGNKRGRFGEPRVTQLGGRSGNDMSIRFISQTIDPERCLGNSKNMAGSMGMHDVPYYMSDKKAGIANKLRGVLEMIKAKNHRLGEHHAQFRSSLPADEIMRLLARVLQDMGGKIMIKKETKRKLKCQVLLEPGRVLNARIELLTVENGFTKVSLRRSRADKGNTDTKSFHIFFERVRSAFIDEANAMYPALRMTAASISKGCHSRAGNVSSNAEQFSASTGN